MTLLDRVLPDYEFGNRQALAGRGFIGGSARIAG